MNISMVPEKIRVSEDATFEAETHPGGGRVVAVDLLDANAICILIEQRAG